MIHGGVWLKSGGCFNHPGFHLNVSYVLRLRHNRCPCATIKTPKSLLSFRSVRAGHNRKAIDGVEAGTLAPGDLGLRDSERQLWPALEQRLQRALAFDARELMAEAEMDAGAERDMPV